uniref:Uncharacterized protein n=1 Tax=Rhizophagus irregularis (strain DAOM 181602 / DAOM 197198 / MUCL 43194) TaxID=747089 RepID=U9T878_RHIID
MSIISVTLTVNDKKDFRYRFNYLNKFIKRRFFLSTSTSSLLLIACVIVVFCAKCSVVTKRSFSFGIIKEGCLQIMNDFFKRVREYVFKHPEHDFTRLLESMILLNFEMIDIKNKISDLRDNVHNFYADRNNVTEFAETLDLHWILTHQSVGNWDL